MAVQIVMSQFGPEMTEGKIVHWLKSEGDGVNKGETLLEIESEKAVVEIQSPADGILGPILKGEGSMAAVGELLSQVFSPDEIVYAATPTPMSTFAPTEEIETESASDERQTRSDGKTKITPLARRLAQSLGIDLGLVRGSGPGGRVIEADIRRASLLPLEQTKPAPETPDLRAPTSPQAIKPSTEDMAKTAAPTPKLDEMPLDGMRAVIANRMHESHQVTAPVTLTTEVCATAFVELRQQLVTELSTELDFSIGYNDLMIKVIACALHTHRYMNARLEAGAIHLLEHIHVGLAVDTPRGLVVPVIRDAHTKGVAEIGSDLRKLIEKIRAGTASPEDLSGGTFTITNLGMFEIDAFTPIINLPQTAILGVGQIKSRPAVVENQLCIQQMLWLSLTFDHRLVDGAPAARFLQYIKRLIEKPGLLLL